MERKTNKNLSTSSKSGGGAPGASACGVLHAYEGLGAAMAAELMTGF